MAEIKVYSTPGCPWCRKLKAWLAEKSMQFVDIDISKDQEAGHRIVERSGQMGVPQTEIGDAVIVGFNPEAIEKELAKSAKTFAVKKA